LQLSFYFYDQKFTWQLKKQIFILQWRENHCYALLSSDSQGRGGRFFLLLYILYASIFLAETPENRDFSDPNI